MRSSDSMPAPRALSNVDGALGAGTRTSSPAHAGPWRAELGSRPRRRPPRASPAPLFYVDGGGLSAGLISCWT
jgi:hypothetical protein